MTNKSTTADARNRGAGGRRQIESIDLIQSLEEKIEDLRAQLKNTQNILQAAAGKENVNKEVPISYFMANNVGVVGLREAITLNHTPLKITWIILLLAGTAATIFYIFNNTYEFLNKEPATKISLHRSTSYEVPPLILCPPWFFDSETIPHNLSDSAIRYSLAYANLADAYFNDNDLDSFSPNLSALLNPAVMSAKIASNVSAYWKKARLTFHNFYERNNFSSLEDYYTRLAVDILFDSDDEEHENATLHLECTGCNKSHLPEKIVFSNAICYVFHLNKATPRSADEPVHIQITNNDNTGGVLSQSKKSWLMGFMSSLGSQGPSIPLISYSTYNIKLSAQRMISLVNTSNCVDTDKNSTYDQRLCTETCLAHQTYNQSEYLLKGYKSFVVSKNVSEISNVAEVFITVSDLLLDLFSLAIKSGMVINKNEPFLEALNNFDDSDIRIPDNSENPDANVTLHQQINTKSDRNNQSNLPINIVDLGEQANKTMTDLSSAFQDNGPPDEALINCYQSCLPPCDRIIYDITLDHGNIEGEKDQNKKSIIELYIRHSAVFQGGIVVWQEVTTTTFSDFVSNVGGTLGLFLGCTILTLAQLVLSFLNYSLDQRALRGRQCDPPAIAGLGK